MRSDGNMRMKRLLLSLLAALALLAGSGSAAAATKSSSTTVWVMGVDQIAPIRTASRTLGTAINLGFCEGAMAIGPNGDPWVLCGSSVLVIDSKTDTPTATIADPEDPTAIVFAHGDAYVLNDAMPPSIYEIDAATRKVIHEIPFTQNSESPWVGLRYSPSLKMIYVQSDVSGTTGFDGLLLPFDPVTNKFEKALDVPGMWNAQMVMAPNGKTAAFFGSETDYGTVALVNVRTHSVKLSPDLGNVQDLAFSSNGKALYVAFSGENQNGLLEKFSLPTFKVEHRWMIRQQPRQVYVNRFAVFVLSFGPTINSGGANNEAFTVISASTVKVLSVKEMGPGPNIGSLSGGVVFDPRGGLGWVISRSTTVTPFEIRTGSLLAPIKIPYGPSTLAIG